MKVLDKEFKRQVLLDVVKEFGALLEDNSYEISNDVLKKLFKAWKKLLFEILGIMVTRSSEVGYKRILDLRKPHLHLDPKIYRVSNCGQMPLIRMSGLWLKKYGFVIGEKIEIYPLKNQLILNLEKERKKSEGLALGEDNG